MKMQKQKKRAFDKEKSRIKLMVYDQNDNGKAFYSFIRDDRKGYEYTIKAMKLRILRDYYRQKFKKAIFFNTHTDSVIERITNDEFAQKFTKSKVKLLVYDSLNKRHQFFPTELENACNIDFILGAMTGRIVNGLFNNQFNVAIFYRVENGEEITRLGKYGKIKQVI